MLILTDTNNRFELHSERTLRGQYDGAVREVAKEARFRFDGNTKTWWTNDPEIALRVVPAVDPKKSAGVIGQAKAELAKKNATTKNAQDSASTHFSVSAAKAGSSIVNSIVRIASTTTSRTKLIVS